MEQPNQKFKVIMVSLLIALIAALFGGILFFDQISSIFRAPKTENREMVDTNPLPTLLPTLDPEVVCASFTDLEYALENIDKACILDLSNRNLATLPADISKLKNLNEINLSKNNLSAFPEELTNLEKLTSINLSENNIATVSPSISKVAKLQVLDLSRNKLTGLPGQIGQIKNLSLLTLTGNNISASEQEEIKNLFPVRKEGQQITIQF